MWPYCYFRLRSDSRPAAISGSQTHALVGAGHRDQRRAHLLPPSLSPVALGHLQGLQTRHPHPANQVQQEADQGADRGVQGVFPGLVLGLVVVGSSFET